MCIGWWTAGAKSANCGLNVGNKVKFYQHFLWTIVTIGVAFVSYEAGMLIRDTRLNQDKLMRPAQQLLANWNSVAVTSSQVLSKERDAFGAQQAYFMKLGNQTDTAMEAFNATLDKFNGEILPRVSGNLDSSRQLIDDTGASVAEMADSVGRTLDTAGKVVADTEPILENTAEITRHAAATSANLEGMTADLHALTSSLVNPKKGFWQKMYGLVKVAWAVRGASGL